MRIFVSLAEHEELVTRNWGNVDIQGLLEVLPNLTWRMMSTMGFIKASEKTKEKLKAALVERGGRLRDRRDRDLSAVTLVTDVLFTAAFYRFAFRSRGNLFDQTFVCFGQQLTPFC